MDYCTTADGATFVRRPRAIHGAILLVTSGLTTLATAILGPSLPKMQIYFGSEPNADYLVPLTLTVPMLTMAVLSIFAGSLADRYGRKRMLAWSTAIYALCGTAPCWLQTLPAILASRAAGAIREALGPGSLTAETQKWLRELREIRRRHEEMLNHCAQDSGTPMHPAALSQELVANLGDDAITVFDGGHTTFWSNDFTPARAPRTRLHEVGMTQLGFGLPYAIAAGLLNPGKPVINITGDGAFGFTIQELDTARRYGVPVVTVVHNNAAWGIIRHVQERTSGFSLGGDLSGPDYAAIARGFGCHGEVVEHRGQIGHALKRALESGLPSVIDCRVRFVPHPCLADFGHMSGTGLKGAFGSLPAQ